MKRLLEPLALLALAAYIRLYWGKPHDDFDPDCSQCRAHWAHDILRGDV